MTKPLFISLGENCMPSYYLRHAGLREAAYPFDWCFSHPRIIEECLLGDFSTFLNPEYIAKAADGDGASHARYHKAFFRHKDASTPEGRAYYARAIERFRKAMDDRSRPIVFMALCRVGPEPECGWRAGIIPPYDTTDGRVRQVLWMKLLDKLLALRTDATAVLIREHGCDQAAASMILPQWSQRILADLLVKGPGGAPYADSDDDAQARFLFGEIKATIGS